jgi:hypothetical protein
MGSECEWKGHFSGRRMSVYDRLLNQINKREKAGVENEIHISGGGASAKAIFHCEQDSNYNKRVAEASKLSKQ